MSRLPFVLLLVLTFMIPQPAHAEIARSTPQTPPAVQDTDENYAPEERHELESLLEEQTLVERVESVPEINGAINRKPAVLGLGAATPDLSDLGLENGETPYVDTIRTRPSGSAAATAY